MNPTERRNITPPTVPCRIHAFVSTAHVGKIGRTAVPASRRLKLDHVLLRRRNDLLASVAKSTARTLPRGRKSVDGFRYPADGLGAPLGVQELRFVILVGEVAELQQHRRHVRRF